MKGTPPAWAAAPSTQESPTTTMRVAAGHRARTTRRPSGSGLSWMGAALWAPGAGGEDPEARKHEVRHHAVVVGPDGGGVAERLQRRHRLHRVRDEHRRLHGSPPGRTGNR